MIARSSFSSLNCVMKVGGAKDRSNMMGQHKKQKATMPVWRPISTQSENAPGSCGCETDSKSNEVRCQKEVMEETLQESSSNKYAEFACGVEKYSISVEVDSSLIHFIKGKGGSVQTQIEGELAVKIIFPSSKEDNCIVIEGNSVESVTKASEKIATIVEEAVKSPRLDYSHFISLPLAIHPELVEKLNHFQNSILGDAPSSQDDNLESAADKEEDEEKQSESPSVAVNLEVQDEKEHKRVKTDTVDSKSNVQTSILSDLGIDRSIFIKPRTFHLTVLMLKLWNKDRVAAATEVLQGISSKVKDALDNRPVVIGLKGLTCMRGSPAKARVVYAPVTEIGGEGRLLRACQVMIDAYVEAGLVLEKDAHQTLKLHATLMNVRHRKRKRTRRHDSFDARHIFKVHGSKDWGEYLIREVHLSQRFKFDESGYYHCCASIPLPENMQTE
ncbi:activating signal cointegrator 1 complex subunit 1-like isoform X2 [Phoenix dactylifera]|uniref:Activating signal cointegrator 1 complex subunit 1-like isoform X2 n=1 Tax=Phoenix dactylifera TaxID=42345 RepID=A0A8B9AGT0_PHODC|nr:activating signal cointegrator 1 complex subunit 1-like isoform X2 [Phoenix dactylifera]